MVEVLWDMHAEAAANELVLGGEHQLLGSYPWLEWLRRQTGNPRLFVYQHRVTGNFVLCVWVYSPQESSVPVAIELHTFSVPPNILWPLSWSPQEAVHRLGPVNVLVKEKADRRKEKAYSKRRGREDTHAQKQEAMKYLKGKGMDRAAHDLDIGKSPFVGNTEAGEENERWTETLKRLRRAL